MTCSWIHVLVFLKTRCNENQRRNMSAADMVTGRPIVALSRAASPFPPREGGRPQPRAPGLPVRRAGANGQRVSTDACTDRLAGTPGGAGSRLGTGLGRGFVPLDVSVGARVVAGSRLGTGLGRGFPLDVSVGARVARSRLGIGLGRGFVPLDVSVGARVAGSRLGIGGLVWGFPSPRTGRSWERCGSGRGAPARLSASPFVRAAPDEDPFANRPVDPFVDPFVIPSPARRICPRAPPRFAAAPPPATTDFFFPASSTPRSTNNADGSDATSIHSAFNRRYCALESRIRTSIGRTKASYLIRQAS